LRVAQISFFLDPLQRNAARILQDWWPLVDAAEVVVQAGASVSVIQACCESQNVTRNGVSYHFVSPERGSSSIAPSAAFASLLRELQPDVFHVHGLSFCADLLALAKLAPHTPIFLQDHAEKLPRLWRRSAFRRGVAVAAGVSFCALEQARRFREARLFHPQTALFEIPECSSRFAPGDAHAARLATGVHGDPAVLWVGHLNANKGPLAVLAGIAAAVERLPGLQLWCCFGSAPLMPEVRARIDADPRLRGRVHLLGKVPHATIEQLMRAADLFVLGSRNEGSGCSLIEALACGLPPVVTDIPSFRALTGNGKVGMLWPHGDSARMCEALLSVASRPRQPTRSAVRAHFDNEVSFAAVGRKLVDAYGRLLNRVTELEVTATAGGS
jgi:glycosyltransferase involved in cell wall biosynthesis